jgi:peptidoglycan/xylan/chitin deacetylase (PgdA/CDA1 family)
MNARILKQLNSDSDYKANRDDVLKEFKIENSGAWGEFVKGVGIQLDTKEKIIALTFDACGGKYSSGYDSALISYLKINKIKATLFVTGKWIDSNYKTFLKLSRDSLFEIENHGLNHKPCSFKGESAYGIKGTADPKSAYDEIEVNAEKIFKLTGRKPAIYRSGTAFIDEACVQMAFKMGYSVISYDVLSTDAMPLLPSKEIISAVLKHIHPGAIVIMHFNHPEWNTANAIQTIIPELIKQGYSFVLLKNQHLLSSKPRIKH